MSYDTPEVFRKDDIPPHLGITQLLTQSTVWHRCDSDEWVAMDSGIVRNTKRLTEDYTILVEHPSALPYADALVTAYKRQATKTT